MTSRLLIPKPEIKITGNLSTYLSESSAIAQAIYHLRKIVSIPASSLALEGMRAVDRNQLRELCIAALVNTHMDR